MCLPTEESRLNPSVLHVYKTYFPDPPGGMQQAIRQVTLSTTAEGLKNTIFTLSPQPVPSLLVQPEAQIFRSRSWLAPASCDIGGTAAFADFSRLARDSDILHYYFPWPFADVLDAAINSSRPAVLTYVSDVVRQRVLGAAYRPLMWRTLRKMRVIVASSSAYVNSSSILSPPEIRAKVRVIPFGIEENSYPKHGDDSIIQRLGLESGEPFFLFVGVLRYYKGLPFLVRAAKNIGARIIVAGTGPEGAKLHSLVTEMALKNVVFAGQVTEAEKISLIRQCRAVILPSHLRSEAYGMVLVEAAMLGRPLISCEIGTGTSYINLHEKTGLVVAPGAPEKLKEAMNILLKDDHLAARMGAAARERYEQNFSGTALGRAYAALFREVAQANC